MKKLITGAIAAMALLFGFAACSGDLHDNDVQPLYVVGAGFEGATWELEDLNVKAAQATLVESDGTIQKFELKATASTAQVKFATARSWSNDIAGSDLKELIPVVNGDAVSLYSREANALPNTNNVVINDLTVGETYIIDINFNPISLATSIKVSGNAVVAPDMQIIVSTGESKPTISKIPMTRAGATYTYEFIAAETLDNLSFYFYCPSLNTTYYVDNNKLVQINVPLKDAHGNVLNGDGDTVVEADNGYALDVWKNARKVSIVKNHKYSIKIEANDGRYGFNGAISYAETEEAILKDAALIGQWEYTDNHDGDYAIKPTGNFVANSSTVEFKMLRYSDSNEMAFGSAVELKPGSDYAYGEEKEIEYLTTQVIDDNKFSYKAAEKDTNALEKVKYIKVADLKKGQKYEFKFDTTDIANGKIKVSVAEYEELDLSVKIQACEFKGAFDGWDATYSCEEFKDGVLEITGLVNEKGGADFECGIFETSKPDSLYKYCNATIDCENNEVGTYGDDVEFPEYAGNETIDNARIKGLVPNAKFDIKITTKDGKVYVAVKVTEAGVEDTRTFAKIIEDDYYIKGGIIDSWWSFNVFATSGKTVVSNANDKAKEVREIFYGPFDKARAGEFLLTNGGIYYKGMTVKYLTGNNAYAQFIKDKGNNSKVDLSSNFPADKKNFYIVVKADSSNNKVWAKIEPTDDSIDIPNQFLKGLTVSGWCRDWKADNTVAWVDVASPAENTLGNVVLSNGKYTWTADFKIPDKANVIDLSVHSGDWKTRYESTSTEKLSLDTEYALKAGLEAKDPGSGEEGRGAFAVEGGKTYTVTYILEYNPGEGGQTLKYKLTAKN